jgi:L-seryl-tRNA(Ser) seleniumtransferase
VGIVFPGSGSHYIANGSDVTPHCSNGSGGDYAVVWEKGATGVAMSETPSLRQLPAVARVLEEPLLEPARRQYGAATGAAVREVLAQLRQRLRAGEGLAASELEPAVLAQRALDVLHRRQTPSLRPVINATGIVLHTNLGRAPLSESAARAAYLAARHYTNLEIDLASGRRSHRQEHIRQRLCQLSGAEAAAVVNNCAAATILVLRVIAAGREVVVSRGQLIEIGGSFRIPEIMAVSGAILREVGTTNITRLADYERAIGPQTAALMRIHTSNYRIRGFTRGVSLAELVALGQRYQLPVIDDIGSGLIVDLSPWGLPSEEPLLPASVRAGVDVVICSGDKLLGGPQAGLIVGRKVWLERIERDPFFRAVRPDKMTLAALEATLRHYEDSARAHQDVPVLHLLTLSPEHLQRRCAALAERLQNCGFPARLEVVPQVAYAGGGSLPETALPTFVLQIRPHQGSEHQWAASLRCGQPPVIVRLGDGCLWLDLRTVFVDQEDVLIERLWQTAQQFTCSQSC